MTRTCAWRCAAVAVWLLAWAAATGPAAQTPAAAATGAISGVVSDAATGRPVAGAVVSLRRQGPPAPGQVGQQLTDGRGRFVFDELMASKQYFLDVMKPGYVDGHYAQAPNQNGFARFALAEGQWLNTANVTITRVGAIGGTVSDEFGEPVVGAFVRVLEIVDVAGHRALAAGPAAKTDDRGEYRIGGLMPARYLVMLPSVQHSVPASSTPADVEAMSAELYDQLQAELARNAAVARLNNGAVGEGAARLIIGNYVTPPAPVDGHDRAYPITFFPGTVSAAGASAIDLSDGLDKSGVNMTMQPVPAVRVSGRLAGVKGGAALTLRLIAAGLEGLGAGTEVATTVAEADGTFTFLSVPAGNYTLTTRQSMFEFTAQPLYVPYATQLPRTPGREPGGGQMMGGFAGASSGTGFSLRYIPEPDVFGSTGVTVGAANLSDVVVLMQPAVTIQGRFVYEDMPNGPPPRAGSVFLEPAGSTWAQGPTVSVNEGPSGDPGSFTIRSVVPGLYTLRPALPPGTVVKSIVSDGQDYVKAPIELAAGRDVEVAVTFTGRVPSLAGGVRDAQGRAVEGATVLVFSTDRTTWPNLGLMPLVARVTSTSAGGTFALATLPAGEYYVIALDPILAAGWTDPAFLAKASAVARRVRLDWGVSTPVDLTIATVK